jgi:hypothetical protein
MKKKTWKEFQKSGLLWWVNRSLHLFGWAIVIAEDSDTGEVADAYPVRCSWRGFEEDTDAAGFLQLTTHMAIHGEELVSEVEKHIASDDDD